MRTSQASATTVEVTAPPHSTEPGTNRRTDPALVIPAAVTVPDPRRACRRQTLPSGPNY